MPPKLPLRPHAHRADRSRGRFWSRFALVPIAAAAVAVAGSAVGLPVPGVDAALGTAAATVLGDTSAAGHPHALVERREVAPAPTSISPAASPVSRTLVGGRTLSPASPSSKPTATRAPARPAAARASTHAAPSPTPASRPAKKRPATKPKRHHAPATPGPTHSATPHASPSATPSATPNPAAAFRVASFNMLGASHTGPHSERPRFATGVTRAPWAVSLLNGAGITVAGLQEFQPPQIRVFNRVATGWRAWPGLGSRAGVNSVIWRTGSWRPVETHTLAIPYFFGHAMPMPYVLLRNVDTGRRVWFANFHNPADAHGPAQRWRNEAVRREVALVNRLHADGTPVVVTGDFNDRDAFFCPLASGAGVTSADGSHRTGSGCDLAPHPGVDWIVGTRDNLDFTDFHRIRGGLVGRTSDHPFVWSRVAAD